MNLYKLIYLLRHTGYLFIIGICAFWFIDNYAGGYVNWFILTIGTLSIIQLFARAKMIDLLLGAILVICSLYMSFAVFSDFIHYQNGKPCNDPVTYFGSGFGIFLTALILSVCITGTYFLPKNKPAL